jgi:DNA-binding CsgD family transcriptional regulator
VGVVDDRRLEAAVAAAAERLREAAPSYRNESAGLLSARIRLMTEAALSGSSAEIYALLETFMELRAGQGFEVSSMLRALHEVERAAGDVMVAREGEGALGGEAWREAQDVLRGAQLVLLDRYGSHTGRGRANGTLSSRERDVLTLLGEGLRYEAIAGRLGVTAETARTYLRRAMGKLGADTTAQAVAVAVRRGLLD